MPKKVNYDCSAPEYKSWQAMKNRCYNEKFVDYKYYGGKGVTVCERWRNSYQNFLDDMGRRPSAEHSIDRYPDINGNYNPLNCRWATKKEQARNRGYCKFYNYNGTLVHLEDLAKILKTYPSNINRMLLNKSVEQIIDYYEERNNRNRIGENGRLLGISSPDPKSLRNRCLVAGVSYSSVFYIMKEKGLSESEAINYYVNKN